MEDLTNTLEEAFKSIAKNMDKKVKDEEAAMSADASKSNIQAYQDAISSFANAYRDALGVQKDLAMQNLEQNRRNAQQSIMGNANTYGMMYSNFPERAKIQYDTSTYMPARAKTQSTYQTGLDALRSSVTEYLNKLADYDAEIESLNKQYNKNTKGTALNKTGDTYKYNAVEDRTWFYNANGDPIRFGTTVSREGTPTTKYILSAAGAVLDDNAAKWLGDIYEKARSNGYTNIVVNAGDKFSPNSLNFLSEAERDFMDSLGLTFAQ